MIITALILLSFVIAAYFYNQFPARIASHWDAQGNAGRTCPVCVEQVIVRERLPTGIWNDGGLIEPIEERLGDLAQELEREPRHLEDALSEETHDGDQDCVSRFDEVAQGGFHAG